jgi:hypothetical protein
MAEELRGWLRGKKPGQVLFPVKDEQINPKLVLRLFHSGPGTLWTNLDNKNMNLMMPLPGAAPTPVARDGKAAVPEK